MILCFLMLAVGTTIQVCYHRTTLLPVREGKGSEILVITPQIEVRDISLISGEKVNNAQLIN